MSAPTLEELDEAFPDMHRWERVRIRAICQPGEWNVERAMLMFPSLDRERAAAVARLINRARREEP